MFLIKSPVEAKALAPWSGIWINQQQLIDAQQLWNTFPLVLEKNNACFNSWRSSQGWNQACW